MRIHNIYKIQLLALLTAFTACSSEESVNTEGPKTTIDLKVGVEGLKSRVITDESSDKTFSAFSEGTGIWMAMQSDYKYLGTSETPDEKDYKGSKEQKYCVTYGTTGAATGTVNSVDITGDYIRYWDDAHARSSALSIWALAVPGKASTEAPLASWNTAAGWGSTNSTKTIKWSIANAQDATTVAANDLCFSNNIADYTSANPANTDRRMKYGTTTPGKFDEGKLVFYHALTKITIKMIEGDGFDHSSTSDFQFDAGTATLSETAAPVVMKGFSVSGTFDVAEGAFNSIGTQAPITTMHTVAITPDLNNPYYTLEALVMPGTNLSSTNILDAISFSIDGNAFKVSSATLVEKLKAGDAGSDWNGIIEAGKNYIFTFRVSKTAIKVNATVKDWDVINAAKDEPIIRVDTAYGQEANSDEHRTVFTKDFSFLKSTTLSTGYSDDADAEYQTSKYTLKPAQYWPNHNTHYFIRGVWPLIGSKNDGTNTPTGNVSTNAITVNNAAFVQDKYPADLMLGYPRTTSETCSAHSKVVATEGICATEGDIRMNFQRVMSKIEVNLKSSDDTTAPDYITFDANTKVEIIDGYTESAIMLSDGSSNVTGKTKETYVMHRYGDTNIKYVDAVVPQTLLESTTGGTDNIKFRITVKSNDGWEDKYETVLGIKSIPVIINDASTNIDTWEPGKHYVYTLTITKTGIKVTATIKDWIEARGSTTITM